MIDIGKEFKATLVVHEYCDEDEHGLVVKELNGASVDTWFSEIELLEAFDPETKRKRLLAQKEEIEKQLKEMEMEENV